MSIRGDHSTSSSSSKGFAVKEWHFCVRVGGGFEFRFDGLLIDVGLIVDFEQLSQLYLTSNSNKLTQSSGDVEPSIAVVKSGNEASWLTSQVLG
jgi:hypothetical protein